MGGTLASDFRFPAYPRLRALLLGSAEGLCADTKGLVAILAAIDSDADPDAGVPFAGAVTQALTALAAASARIGTRTRTRTRIGGAGGGSPDPENPTALRLQLRLWSLQAALRLKDPVFALLEARALLAVLASQGGATLALGATKVPLARTLVRSLSFHPVLFCSVPSCPILSYSIRIHPLRFP
jgi:hypothetical protein